MSATREITAGAGNTDVPGRKIYRIPSVRFG